MFGSRSRSRQALAATIGAALHVEHFDLDTAAVGPLGTALAIVLAFRNATAYDR
jgi:predicted membrane chloride channel (bestrophin family)